MARKPSLKFAKKLSLIVKNKFKVDLHVYFKTFKNGSYLKLKSPTVVSSFSKVVYKYSCSCDTNTSCVGMTSLLAFDCVSAGALGFTLKSKSAVKVHIENCSGCQAIFCQLKFLLF